ncbi:hypothetical protein CVT24_001015 [Panaeolus cyanescens]|uniref:Major facilitator superfamily (MFS) profile domain-containing protein n=1 Tax=Panaeolus cyanescens TaxID=181874 RepID=A0A409YTH0_9AGAR|nr:hypothetical protein CVT24_001015 [Panaeolus cyanescens]
MVTFSALPSAEEGPDNQQRFKGVSRILGPKWAHMPIITIGLLGVQIFWSVEMSYASPYLLSLGLSKSSMAIVFVAGPISGLVMQPLIGVLADSSTSRFGRRRPFMLVGTVICILAMLLLGFTRSVASIFTGWDNSANDALTIWLAVLAIYLIDFSINAVQAVDRALLVDTIPSSEQASGNAWAARMLGVGSVVGFFAGNVDLPRILPIFGDSQLKVLSVVVSILLLGGHVLMCVLVKEKVLLKEANGKSHRKSFVGEMKDIWANMRTLPHVIQQICLIQFFSWIAWFPILFYSTIYVGDFHKRKSPPATNPHDQALLDTEATRLGSRALFYSAAISLFLNLVLPAFVPDSAARAGPRSSPPAKWGLVIPPSLHVHLSTLWAVGNLVLAACMFATFFVDSVWGATMLIAVTGFSWAVSQWAPFSLLAEAILTEPAPYASDAPVNIRLADARSGLRSSADNEREVFLPGDVSDEEEDEERLEERRRVLGNSGAQVSRIRIRETEDEDYQVVTSVNGERSHRRGGEAGTLSAKAGIILGIHNIFIVIPQFIVTGFSAVLFALLDGSKPRLPDHRAPVGPAPVNGTLLAKNGTEELISRVGEVLFDTRAEVDDAHHSNSIVYIFRIGGVAAAFAFVLCWRLSRTLRHKY